MKEFVLFDFDGTLAPSLLSSVQAYNRVAPWLRCNRVAFDEIKQLQELNTQNILRKLRVSYWKLPLLLVLCRYELKKAIYQVEVPRNRIEVLQSLKKAGCCLALVSTNSRAKVEKSFPIALETLFDVVHCGTSFFGKAQVLSRILQKHHWELSKSVYVGDERRDARAAESIGLAFLGVGWGFHSKEALHLVTKKRILEDPCELLSQILS